MNKSMTTEEKLDDVLNGIYDHFFNIRENSDASHADRQIMGTTMLVEMAHDIVTIAQTRMANEYETEKIQQKLDKLQNERGDLRDSFAYANDQEERDYIHDEMSWKDFAIREEQARMDAHKHDARQSDAHIAAATLPRMNTHANIATQYRVSFDRGDLNNLVAMEIKTNKATLSNSPLDSHIIERMVELHPETKEPIENIYPSL